MTAFAKFLASRWKQSRFGDERRIDSEAFYQGAHGVPLENGIAEVQAGYEEKKCELKQQSIVRQKQIEGELEHLESNSRHALRLWAAVQERAGDCIPTLIVPSIVAIVGAGALISEALLLAPAMDVLNVTDPTWQKITAFGFAAGAASAFHFGWESFTSQQSESSEKRIFRIIAAFFAAGLIFWGIFRGLQVGYAATLNRDALGQFLNGHSLLAGCFYVFVTLGIPVVAATASHYSAHYLHLWWEWKTAKRAAEALSKSTMGARKNLESERESLTHSLRKLDEECKRHCASYRQHHRRGELRRARQEPFWMVSAKATLVALTACVALIWVFLFPILLIFPVMTWLAVFIYFYRQWQSPSPNQYFALENVRFAEVAVKPQRANSPSRVSPIRAISRSDRKMATEAKS
jgi:hypothetical protein